MNNTEKNWDREWARQLRAEHRWQRQALNRTPGRLQRELESRVPEAVRKSLTGAFRASLTAALDGESLLRRTVSRPAVEKRRARTDALLRSPGRFGGVRDPAKGVVRTAAAAAAVRSAGLGLLGIGLPDIPVFTALLLRNMGQIAHGYGCGTGTRRDRLLWLRILDAALTDGPDYPRRAQRAAQALAGEPDDPACLPELTGRVAEGLCARLLAAKFLQGIPLAGAAGSLADSRLTASLLDYTALCCNRQYLLGHCPAARD